MTVKLHHRKQLEHALRGVTHFPTFSILELRNHKPVVHQFNGVSNRKLFSPARFDLAIDLDFPRLNSQFRFTARTDQPAPFQEIIQPND